MDTAELINALDREGRLLAEAAGAAGPDAPVPTCPDWQVRDLLRHTGTVHRWATAYITEGHTAFHPSGEEPDLDGDELLDWFREGHRALVGALTGAPKDLECWHFLPAASPLAFWARRQAHETAVHRVDAESARGGDATAPEPEFAVDGIDELLRAFHAREQSRVRTPTPRTLRARATDTDAVWTVHLSDGVPRTVRDDDGPADCELSGTAHELYLTLWNRRPLSSVALAGDSSLAELWRANSAITWS
ncbi:maleylpyruvate isomerase family mycothiol-dependent enzyme [Streptomyces sp. BPTC-684]|uniref:maleylpyruvate isomerase family mycothiol-dependent enzyme n=1 Tax=Streptomyces sp. BPTC-684 TaxID=3043734 RepID=UPI0024B23301|nr:maleylpyruvate isomerase family mycothiol-dependent enzyme [Streptomyces sp. BPTC-684]WHM39997.1 maleylpyruvate isomerase family mycothiol-dependent enzyme [Streptomyces sp. BPTC-684]